MIDVDGLMAVVQTCDMSDVEVLELEFPMRSKLLYSLLAASCQGRALGIVRAVVRSSGLMAWRKLVSEYEPDLASRRMIMLSGILNPNFIMEKFPEQVLEWERQIALYQAAAKVVLPDDVKCSVLAQNAPPPIKAWLFAELRPVAEGVADATGTIACL